MPWPKSPVIRTYPERLLIGIAEFETESRYGPCGCGSSVLNLGRIGVELSDFGLPDTKNPGHTDRIGGVFPSVLADVCSARRNCLQS
jgi:hypothetical protein